MSRRLPLLALSAALATPFACGPQDGATRQAQEAALAWLALTDSGQYGPSWDGAATPFQAALARSAWVGAMTSARAPLGAPRSRKLLSATATRSLPGAPDGEYVVIQYETRFEHKASALETVTPMHDKDGAWKVSGYYIK
jgi:hypothetical protein